MVNAETDNRINWSRESQSARADVERFGAIQMEDGQELKPKGTPELVWARFKNLMDAGRERGWVR